MCLEKGSRLKRLCFSTDFAEKLAEMSKPSSLGSGAFEGFESLEAVTVKMLEMRDGSMEADGMECAL